MLFRCLWDVHHYRDQLGLVYSYFICWPGVTTLKLDTITLGVGDTTPIYKEGVASHVATKIELWPTLLFLFSHAKNIVMATNTPL